LQALCNSASSIQKYSLDYLIFATGRDPALEMIGDEFREKFGKLQDEHRLYLAGDVKNGIFRQLSIAVGDGVRTAMEIFQHESDQQNRE
jgi:pyruvate/2-oxoglutarate dehydrogenase complex dihydrolipoamide dehydrogenase (E3) component